MKIDLIKLSGKLFTSLLKFLGFTACDNGTAYEYITPFASYTIRGRVTDNNGNPIPGIRVSVEKTGLPVNRYLSASELCTSSIGEFSQTYKNEFPRDINFKLTFTDIDGALNGEFKPKQHIITIPAKELQGGKGWFAGKVLKEIEIKLDHLLS